MKKKTQIWKKFTAVLIAVFSLILLSPEAATHLGAMQTVQAAVKLNAKTVKLVKGQKKTLKVTGTKKKPKWTSNKKSVAAVSSSGVVTAKKKGTAVITAKVGSKKYTCKVTVEAPKLNKTSVTLNAKKTYQLKLTGTTQKPKWTSSNKAVATVSSKGKVTAKSAGTATVTAVVGGVKFNCKVTVKGNATTNSSTTGFRKLITYIQNKGNTNSDGNKFISINEYDTESGMSVNAGIIYNTSKDELELVLTTEMDAGSTKTASQVTISRASTTAPVYYVLVFNSQGVRGAVELKTMVNMKTYTDNTELSFQTISDTTNSSTGDLKKLGNAYLQLGFLCWQELLKQQPEMTLKDIGFVAYK
ncbi:Ig-like domain-containing protein [Blautia sp. HCP3S3_H10_1]|uniref:Ig-like domain-containing protein n=1 Tax=unclassified Blautia TaxID=2648079 RepID=UPI003F9045E0|nr:Ig-like domain-containing protein [Clostridia bacterium]